MKVFGVGFQRTGTTSLAAALNMIGIKTRQFPKELYYDIDNDIIREFDGFTDDPITLLYKTLDTRHPNSKFIHTLRDEKSWLKSIEWLFTTGSIKFQEALTKYGNEFNKQLFGTTEYDPELFLEKYRAYNQEVFEYFSARQNDYLKLDLTKGEGFEKICLFLGKPIPENTSFPHRNQKENIVKVRTRKFYRQLRSGLKNIF